MSISPLDIQQQQFKGKMFGGLDPDEVDSFLQLVSQQMENLIRENSDLKDQCRRYSADLDDLRQRETNLRETMLAAQKITEEMKSNAHKEANLTITEAEIKAERILADAEQSLLNLNTQIHSLRREKLQFEASFKSVLENHLKLLNSDAE